ncbi:MAG: polyphosphate polymerase domain-containing protein [Lachnospiraceae bacterium]|nr:polyphosphate polymerase domain-containing protein [Lachnospiraceae bacterium]
MHMAETVFKRYEKKYLLTAEQERDFLRLVEDRMIIDQYGLHTICNIYFDTPDFDLIRTSIEKPIYKEKLRLRSYGVPESPDSKVYVELKKKFKGIVYKRRVGLKLSEAEAYLYDGVHPQKDNQIMREIDWFLETNPVEPQVYLAYDRRAFYGLEDSSIRLTLDKNIRCRRKKLRLGDGTVGEQLLEDDMTLMEIKLPEYMPMWMAMILSELKVAPVSISKYGTFYCENPEMYMSIIENHRPYLGTSGSVVDLGHARLRKDASKDKKTK